MRNLKLAFAAFLFAVILCSCHHSSGGDMVQTFPIQSELESEYKVLDWSELTPEERHQYRRVNYVIDSQEDFPDENLLGLDRIKSMNIDFEKYTLLLSYNLIPGIVEGHKYLWTKNLQEGVFELWMHFDTVVPESGTSSGALLEAGSQSEAPFIITYYCTALLVNKIPAHSQVIFWL